VSRLWKVTFFSKEVRAEVAMLPKGILAKYARLTELIEKHGPNIGMPHTRHMGKGLIELRIKALEGIARVFYVTVLKNEIVVLHSIIKKTQKTPKKDLDLAYKRLSEVNK
jgi:phage-related protein